MPSSTWTTRPGPSPATATEFLGRNGTLRNPAAMTRSQLSDKVGAGSGSLCRDPGSVRARRRAGARDRLQARRGARRRRRRQPGPALPRAPAGAQRARSGVAVLEPHARRGAGGNARPVPQRADQRLAPVPDSGVPPVGAQRILPVGRRLRFPRSVAGRDGAHPRRAAPAARAPAPLRGPPVPRRRRPALVASAVGPRRAHALLGRLSLAAAGDVPLRPEHRGHRRAG